MLELRLGQDSLIFLKNVLESNDLFGYADLDFSSTGLDAVATDRRVRAFVTLHLSLTMFKGYYCDKSVSIGIDLKKLATILDCARKDDTVTLKANDEEAAVTFIFDSPTEGKIQFEIILYPDLHLMIPKAQKVDAKVTMPSAIFASISKTFSGIGKTVVISLTEVGLKFSTKGNSTNIVFTEKTTAEKNSVPLTVDLTYLNSFTKVTALSNTVSISFSSARVLVDFMFDQMDAYIRFYLDDQDDEGDEVDEADEDDEDDEDDESYERITTWVRVIRNVSTL